MIYLARDITQINYIPQLQVGNLAAFNGDIRVTDCIAEGRDGWGLSWAFRQRHERNAAESLSPLPGLAADDPAAEAFPAVALAIGARPCPAALEARGQSFLAGDAPTLPLPECDCVCECRFSELEDRRVNEDRRLPDHHVIEIDGSGSSPERRKGRDRRRRGRFRYRGLL